MATTIVQIKRSSSGNAPNTATLAEAELAYSQDRTGDGANAILYIESVDSGASPVIHKVGGKYYTDIVDTATSSATANKLVKRDSAGSFSANVTTSNIVITPEVKSTGGTTKVSLSDIGIVAIDVDGGQTKFYNSGIEVPGNVFGGTFGGNKLSLTGGSADLISDRTNSVRIITGTGGNSGNTWEFSNAKLTLPLYGDIFDSVGVSVIGRPFNQANVAFAQANVATVYATSAFDQANAAFNAANSNTGGAAFNQANVAFAQANIAFASANIATTYATSAFAQANTATTYATSAFGAANSAASAASSAQGTADGALSQANTATDYAQSAYGQANVATTNSESAFGRANVAFAQANVAFAQANVANDLATKAIANVLAGTGITVTGYSATQPNVTVNLANTNVSSGSYGGTQNGVAIVVDAQGRITSATNTNMSSNLTINGNGGTDVVQIGIDSLTVVGAEGGISSSVTDNVISIVNTGVKTVTAGAGLSTNAASGNITLVNTGVTKVTSAGHGIVLDTNTGNVTATFTGVGNIAGTANEIEVNQGSGNVIIGLPNDVTIGRNLSVTGNLYVSGNVVALPVETLVVNDPLIQLANTNYSTDIIDIGFFGSYGPGDESSHFHAGLFRDASDGKFRLFQGLTEVPGETVNITGNNYSIATIVANLTGGNITSLINAIAVDSGGTGRKTLTANAVLYGDGTNQVALATGSTGQVLQIGSDGMVRFDGIDGGSY